MMPKKVIFYIFLILLLIVTLFSEYVARSYSLWLTQGANGWILFRFLSVLILSPIFFYSMAEINKLIKAIFGLLIGFFSSALIFLLCILFYSPVFGTIALLFQIISFFAVVISFLFLNDFHLNKDVLGRNISGTLKIIIMTTFSIVGCIVSIIIISIIGVDFAYIMLLFPIIAVVLTWKVTEFILDKLSKIF